MRRYIYIHVATDKGRLDDWRYVEDHGRGHGPEVWAPGTEMPRDYPAGVMLATEIGDEHLQLAPLVDGPHVDAFLEACAKLGIDTWATAKEFAAAQPEVALTELCTTERALDDRGEPTGVRKTGPLMVKGALAGDDAAVAADPLANLADAATVEEIA